MPSTSEAQRRAMEAAAAGQSTIGIPTSVGKEFRAADRKLAEQKKKAKVLRGKNRTKTTGVRG